MKRNLKEAILGIEVTQFDGYKADLEEFVNPRQLEEIINDWMPEVLSSDWIKDNQRMWTSIHGVEYYVPANKLYGKIVPKQELPAIPKFVADFLEKFNAIYDSCVRYLVEAHNGDLYYLNDMMVEDGNLTLDEATELCEWAEKQKQSDLLKLINGYTVEKEQQFYARIKGWENVTTGSEAFNWVYFKEEDTVGISKAVENKYQSASFTKYDWNNLGINEHNADFVSVEEVE